MGLSKSSLNHPSLLYSSERHIIARYQVPLSAHQKLHSKARLMSSLLRDEADGLSSSSGLKKCQHSWNEAGFHMFRFLLGMMTWFDNPGMPVFKFQTFHLSFSLERSTWQYFLSLQQ